MERSTYTVTHHGLLIGLYGKTLEEHLGEYGLDIFANAIMRYAHERGQRMRKRAVRDGRRLDHETFLSYGELQIPSSPEDYSIGSESPCLYALLPPLHVAGKLGQIWSGTLRRTVLQICRSPSDPGLSSRSGNNHPVGPGTWRQLLHLFLCRLLSDSQKPSADRSCEKRTGRTIYEGFSVSLRPPGKQLPYLYL